LPAVAGARPGEPATSAARRRGAFRERPGRRPACDTRRTRRPGIHRPQNRRAAGPAATARAARHAGERAVAAGRVSGPVAHPPDQGYPSPCLYDPLLTLTWAAAATTRVGLGTSVLVASQYHPLWLANATASLDALSGGRLTLGVGVGWSAAEFAALGQ